MNSIKRNGVDIEAAFNLASRRSIAKTVIDPVPSISIDGKESQTTAQVRTSLMLRHYIKQMLRQTARSVSYVMRPFTRPVLFRLRNYLISSLRQEMLEEFGRLQDLQREQNQMITLEFERQANSAKIQASMSQKLFARLSAQENRNQELSNKAQLDRIEQYTLLDVNRVAVNAGPDETLIKSTVGYVLCDARDHALLSCLLQAGELEPGTRQVIERIIKPGDVYVDVGANIGLHSIAAARAMSGQGKIIAFEPFEPTRKLLERNLWLNGFSAMSEVSPFALSDRSGSHKLHLGATSGHHSLYELDNPAFSTSASVDINTTTLDDFLPPDQAVKLLKIDAEGAEIDVIRGAQKLLASNPKMFLIVELGLSHLKRNALSIEDWLQQFATFGLTYRVINEQTGALETWSLSQMANSDSINLLFSSPDSLGEGGTDA